MSMLGLLSSPDCMSFFLPGCTDSNFQDLDKSACGCNLKVDEANKGPEELSANISALCLLQDLKRFVYDRVKSIIDPLLPREQAEFRRKKSTADQVILLTLRIFLSICLSDSGI